MKELGCDQRLDKTLEATVFVPAKFSKLYFLQIKDINQTKHDIEMRTRIS
jgi:hypothetical protein